MENLVPFDIEVHLEDFKQFCIESMTWHCEELEKNYGIDAVAIIGQTIEEWAETNLQPYISMNPPQGILYILEVNGEAAGMGALMKLRDQTGEIHRMYNRPIFRGRGLMQKMVNRLLQDGKSFGYKEVVLATPKFAHAAQHIYRKAGFKERPIFKGNEIPPELQQYWLYMEKEL